MGTPETAGNHRTILFTAEADRIQDLLFGAERLREVSGGSFALERFWEEAAAYVTAVAEASTSSVESRTVTSAGGTLQVLLRGPGADTLANELQRDLPDAYAARFGGRLTTAIAEGDDLDEEAVLAVRAAKAQGDRHAVPVHLPYLEPCASCGRAPATTQVTGHDREVVALCSSCIDRRKGADQGRADFIARIPEHVREAIEKRRRERHGSARVIAQDAGEIGAYDGRRMVAYLLADGNRFGELFTRFDPSDDQARDARTQLSKVVGDAGVAGLAEIGAHLYEALPARAHNAFPALPLITGGDDVFALIPAPWALWFADRFAESFLQPIRGALQTTEPPAPTVCCVVVLCKQTLPYKTAHAAGKDALSELKSVARRHAGASLVGAVEMHATAGAPAGPPAAYRAFRAGRKGPTDVLTVADLLDARRELEAALPRTRLAALESLYGKPNAAGDADWSRELERLLRRAPGGDQKRAGLREVLRKLGGGASNSWFGFAPDGMADRSAAADLLHLWRYLERPEVGAGAQAARGKEASV